MPEPQTYRLEKIGELEAVLRYEVECRYHLNKKYCRAVNTINGTYASLGITCIMAQLALAC